MKQSFLHSHQGLHHVVPPPVTGKRTSPLAQPFVDRMRAVLPLRVLLAVTLAGSPATLGCAGGTFRYDRLNAGRDDVELLDLDDLVQDATAPASVNLEQVSYDFASERDEYRLGTNDVLNIFVMEHPEMSSQRVNLGEVTGSTIRKDGFVYLPVLGKIRADGLTVTQFEDQLRTTAKKFVVDPQVSVEILAHESQKFHVLGHVRAPGTFAVDGDTTLLEALTLAGGIGDSGTPHGATVVRNGRMLPIDLVDMLEHGDVSRNVFMRKGDVVYVPDASSLKVFVLGEVQKPTVVPMQNGRMSLAEAVAAAGGPTPARARRELAVIRGGFAKPRVYRIDLEQAVLVDHQIQLKPGDRVVIAPTGLSTSSRYMQQLLPFLVGAQALGLAAQGSAGAAAQAAAITPVP